MAQVIVDAARIRPGQRVVDVRRRSIAIGDANPGTEPFLADARTLRRDWLENGLFSGGFDAAIAIESLSRMADKPRAFAELGRVVRPGGRVVVVDWLTRPRPRRVEMSALLRPLCSEAHVPSLHSEAEYRALLSGAGFEVDRADDLTDRVARTWTIAARRLIPALARDRTLRHRVVGSNEVGFATSLARLRLAYRTGSLRLGLLSAQRCRS
jgi:tocopherol O-methyltransferase